MHVRKTFRQLHLWLSVPLGVVITLICFSGAMLVFEDEVTRALRPEWFTAPAEGRQPLPPGELAARVESTLPEGVHVSGITMTSDPDATCQVNLSRPHRARVYVNPYTGDICGRHERLAFFSTMFNLHRWLLGSRPEGGGVFWGKVVVGTSTLLFVLALLTGVVLWWPRTRRALRAGLKISFRNGWRRLWHGLHCAGGIYALVLLLAMALTGLTWSFEWYNRGFYAFFGAEVPARGGHGSDAARTAGRQGRDRHKAPRTTPFDHWQEVYASLAAANPSHRQITIGTDGTASVATNRYGNMRGVDQYRFEPGTGRLLETRLAAEQPLSSSLRGWIYSVHVGSWGGLTTRVLWFLAALLGASLPLTGYYLWIKRLRSSRKHASRR